MIKGLMRKILSLLFFTLFLSNNLIYCQWENLNSGINDDLSGIIFLGNNGIVVG